MSSGNLHGRVYYDLLWTLWRNRLLPQRMVNQAHRTDGSHMHRSEFAMESTSTVL